MTDFNPPDFSRGTVDTAPKIFTVSEIIRSLRDLVEGAFPVVWVEGEVSNFKHHSSGHIYFHLKDETSVLHAAFFQRANQNLKFELSDGLKVIACGRLSVYGARSECQLIVVKVEPKGVGALQLAFEQLKERLRKEGLFDTARKRPIPPYPSKIGVVTSPTGAAIRDILNIVNRRFSGTQILLNPVRVQGEGAESEIAKAIEELNQFQDIDVLIVGRGGGSLEDLWAFNSEKVARALFQSRIPVISAVGHEVDWTISDFVADLRAPTPSAAAELVTSSREHLELRLSELGNRLYHAIKDLLKRKNEAWLVLAASYAFRHPRQRIEEIGQRRDELIRQMMNYVRSLVSQKRSLYLQGVGRLEALSPLSILSRGFSVTYDSKGDILRDAEGVRMGEKIRTLLAQGEFESEVFHVYPHNGNSPRTTETPSVKMGRTGPISQGDFPQSHGCQSVAGGFPSVKGKAKGAYGKGA